MKKLILVAIALMISFNASSEEFGIKIDLVLFDQKTDEIIGEIHIKLSSEAQEFLVGVAEAINEQIKEKNIISERERVSKIEQKWYIPESNNTKSKK